MAAKKQQASAQIIREVRRILSAFPKGRRADAAWLHASIKDGSPLNASLEEVKAAIGFNHAKGWVTNRFNEETGQDEWSLTPRGKKVEGVR